MPLNSSIVCIHFDVYKSMQQLCNHHNQVLEHFHHPKKFLHDSFFFLIFIYLFFIFIFGCVGSSFLCEGSLQLRQVGATLHRGARASHYRGLSCCRAQAPDAQAQQLWLTGLVAPWHMGSSQTRARTRVPCISRQILNHCATREAPFMTLLANLCSHSQSQGTTDLLCVSIDLLFLEISHKCNTQSFLSGFSYLL